MKKYKLRNGAIVQYIGIKAGYEDDFSGYYQILKGVDNLKVSQVITLFHRKTELPVGSIGDFDAIEEIENTVDPLFCELTETLKSNNAKFTRDFIKFLCFAFEKSAIEVKAEIIKIIDDNISLEFDVHD